MNPDEEKNETVEPTPEDDTAGLPSDLDEGPRPAPVDEVQEAILEAEQAGLPLDVDVDDLPEPLPDLDEGPRPAPVDEVQEALFEAIQEGAPTDVDLDALPEPEVKRPQKIIHFKTEPVTPVTAPAAPPPGTEPPASPAEAAPPPEPQPEPPPPPDPNILPRLADFWLLLALFVVWRGLSLLWLRPGGFIRDWSDFDTLLGIASLSDYGLYPFRHFWLEWPPLVPWLSVAAYRLSLLLPPWPDDPRLWFVLLLGGAFLLFEIGSFVLLYRLARRLFTDPAVVSRVLWVYALLFPPLYAMLGFFDGVALFFILLSLDLLFADRRLPSAVAAGVGFMVKIIPVLAVPVALRRLWRLHQRDDRTARVEMGLYSVVFGLTVVALLLPFLVMGPQWVLASVRAMAGRSSWETVWAVLEGYYGYGVVLGDRLNPAETAFAVHAPILPWPLIYLAGLGLYAFLFTRPADYRSPRQTVAFAGLTVAVFMLFNKGYSPQFLVYLLPFILLVFPTERGLVYALVFTGLNILEQPVYFVLLPQATWLLALTTGLRFLLTALVGLEFAWVIWPAALAGLAQARRKVPVVLAAASVAGLVVLTPILVRTYTVQQLQSAPTATLAGFLQAWAIQFEGLNSRLVLSDQPLYRSLYPALRQVLDLRLADTSGQFGPSASPASLLDTGARVWVLPTGPQAVSLRQTAERRGTAVLSLEFAGVGTAHLYDFRPQPQAFIAPARFIGGIELLAHRVQVRRGEVVVDLYWRAVNPQNQRYTVFTQILNADGVQVAGHDSPPNNGQTPTDTWAVSTVIADRHRIELPSDLPPGEYTVIAGMYNQFGDRLRGIDPDGFGFANRAVPLAVVQLP